MGEQSSDLDLKEVARKNKAAYEAVANVSDWPTVIDSRGKIFRAPREDVDDGLGGDPISPGTVRGRAKVLNAPYEKPLESGEVLVTRATEPSWTPIFINAAAVVLEVGGPLQHGAIIAREYGIPCVSGVETATKVIKDGDLLEVDGTNGVVKIIEHS
jgi:pyruvate,water dikinase